MSTKQSVEGLGSPTKGRSAGAARFTKAPPLAESDAIASPGEISSSPSSVIKRKIRWRWGILAALALALLSLYPQIDLWLTRGADGQGTFASSWCDEEVYAAYINGLLIGRPRTTQPLGIRAHEKPALESLFSIQVIPAYVIVSFARALGLTVTQVFIVLQPLIAFLSALVLFYLLASVTRDEALAALGAIAILIFGTLAARSGVAIKWIGGGDLSTHFPFLRRYQPSVAFPIFLGFVALIWQALARQGRQAWQAAVAAGLVFAILVFSYFFLWTAAAAWLACLIGVWLIARSSDWSMLIKRLTPTALFAVVILALYALLLSHRDPAMDQVQALTLTHAPDFRRGPEFISVASILLLLWGIRQGCVAWRDPIVIFVSSLVLMPFAVFNQQIITGRSLQPIHYEAYIANYVSLLALIFTLALVWGKPELQFTRRLPKLLLVGLICLVLGWGVAELHGVASSYKGYNISRDLFVPVTQRLTSLAAEHGKTINDREVVFSPDTGIISDNIAISAPQAPFWSSHVPVGSGLSVVELHERYFQYLYYSGMRPALLERKLASNDYDIITSLFGYERYAANLTTKSKQITTEEIAEKVHQYSEFVAVFDRERARHPEISYVVIYTQTPMDFSNLDRWYFRDKGERIGPFTLYQVKLR